MLSEVEVVKLEAPGGGAVELRVVDRTSPQPGGTQPGSAQGGSSQSGSAQPGSIQGDSTQGGSTQGGGTQGGGTQGGSGRAGDQVLVVEGIVDTGDGRGWTFRDACLTGAEAATLARWLLRAAKGRLELPDRLTFAAPALTFTLEEHDHLQPRVTIGFSLAAAPPWLGEERDRTYDYPVTLDLDPEALEAAAVDWERQLS